MIKKIVLVLGLCWVGILSAQKSMVNTLKVGLNAGMSLSKSHSMNVGGDVAYQYLITPNWGVGIASGYSYYLAKDNKGIKNNKLGLVPVAGLVRYYWNRAGLYIGTDVGYGFVIGSDKVASNYNVKTPKGGLHIRPEFGYHNRDWNFYIYYSKTFIDKEDGKITTIQDGKMAEQKFGIQSLGIGVAYNIPLGN